MSSAGDAPTTVCPGCGSEVPDASFCGSCGAPLGGDDGRARLRLGAYAAAPAEHTIRIAAVSTLFPHVTRRSRAPLKAGLALVFLTLLAFALLRWQAPMIAVAALGFPLLFWLYLRESGLPARALALPAAVGVALGVGWGWVTGKLIADGHDVAFGGSPSTQETLLGLVVPVAAAALMVVPAGVARWRRPQHRETLDGYVIGAWGAIAFTAAATLTRTSPQLTTGVVAADRPIDSLVVQAGIQGVALPLTAAAVGGLVGVSLWSGRAKLIVASIVVALGLYAVFGPLELAPLREGLHVAVHLLIAVLALLALRVGLQIALLHQRHEPAAAGQSVCPHCESAVPEMSFCPNCGAAQRVFGAVRRTSYSRLLALLMAGLAVAAGAGVVAAILATPEVPAFVCPPDCGRPPIAEPVESNPRFVSENGEFSVQYPGPGTAYIATLHPDGVELEFTGGDTGTMQFLGMPAEGRTPKQIAEELIAESYPNSTVEYEIPNAMVGYELGYGVVADEYPQDASGMFTRLRLLVMVAVKHDYALVAAAIGPYREFSPDYGTGHPSGANLQLALDMGKYVNSFRWGDRLGG